MSVLLVVDDEPNIRYSLEKGLRSDSLQVRSASTGAAGIEAVRASAPDAVIMDVRLPDMNGIDAVVQIHNIDPKLPIIIVTAHGTAETAIAAMSVGAMDYLLKPLDLKQLRELVQRAVDISRMRRVPAVFEQDEIDAPGQVDRIIGNSPAMQEVYKAVGRIAPHDYLALILGESGTGKEVIARAIYQHSRRKNEPFLALNCAAIPENLLESELFGHEKGAFTGADRRRIGKFEQVHRGTLFLDEIGDLALATQAKLLRLLQEQRFERLGGNETIQTDVRLVAATNQDLAQRVAQGKFRSDLYFRLNGYTIYLPPLRDRRSDIPALAQYFAKRYSDRQSRETPQIAPAALDLLMSYPWPGNVRELENVVKYAILNAPANVIEPSSLPDALRRSGSSAPSNDVERLASTFDLEAAVQAKLKAGATDIYDPLCLAVDRIILTAVLRHTKGNQVVASEILGISRTTLRQKLKALQLTVDAQVVDASQGEG